MFILVTSRVTTIIRVHTILSSVIRQVGLTLQETGIHLSGHSQDTIIPLATPISLSVISAGFIILPGNIMFLMVMVQVGLIRLDIEILILVSGPAIPILPEIIMFA